MLNKNCRFVRYINVFDFIQWLFLIYNLIGQSTFSIKLDFYNKIFGTRHIYCRTDLLVSISSSLKIVSGQRKFYRIVGVSNRHLFTSFGLRCVLVVDLIEILSLDKIQGYGPNAIYDVLG